MKSSYTSFNRAWYFWSKPNYILQHAQQKVDHNQPTDEMSQHHHPFQLPSLTPLFCFNERVLRDFLRLSRSSVDDSITENLNALIAPGNRAFDPTITTHKQHVAPPPARRLIDASTCLAFKEELLFPSWKVRSDVLDYCHSVAVSSDPDDPELFERQLQIQRAKEKVVDERLDPYSGRYIPKQARTESLEALIRNEKNVERIVRSRTWNIISERCGGYSGQSADDAFDDWRQRKR